MRAVANGTARTKFPAVTVAAFRSPFPRSEYIPQATPAPSIRIELAKGGAESPGNTKYDESSDREEEADNLDHA